MSALTRGSCPACGRDVALRNNGLVREHQDQIYGGAWGKCKGSGWPNGCNCSICQENGAAFGPVCRGCGCTDARTCDGGCSWVTLDPAAGGPLCSACAGDELS